MFMTSNSYTQVKNTVDWNAVTSYEGKLILLFSILFNLVIVVHKFSFLLVMNWAPNKWWSVESDTCSNSDLSLWQILYVCFASFA